MSKIEEIAQAWRTSRAYVYKLAKKGCPVDDVEAASAWRSAHSKLGVGFRSKDRLDSTPASGEGSEGGADAQGGQGKVGSSSIVGGREGRRPKRLKSIRDSLKNAIAVEEQAADAVQRLMEKSQKDPAALDQMVTAINAYNKAQANRLETEKRVLEYEEARGLLISIDRAKEIIQRAWGPLLARLRACPKRAAARANPADDVTAEAVFREEIEEAISEGQEAYDAELG